MKTKISRILSRANNATNDEERAAIIRDNSSPALKSILGMSFDPMVKWLLPEGLNIPFNPNKDDKGLDERLYVESRRLYLFVDGGNNNLKHSRRLILFVQMLEGLDPEDANMLLYVKDKKLDVLYPNITYQFVRNLYRNGIASHWSETDPREPVVAPKKPRKKRTLVRDENGKFISTKGKVNEEQGQESRPAA